MPANATLHVENVNGEDSPFCICTPPVGWSARLADFDLQIFGRDAWPQSIWEQELASEDRIYIAVTEPYDPLKSIPSLVAIAGIYCSQDAEILTVAVVQRFRRKGIARQLLMALMQRAQDAGAQRVFLEVRAQDIGAQALYRELGFSEVGRRRRYYHDDDAVVMRRKLTTV